ERSRRARHGLGCAGCCGLWSFNADRRTSGRLERPGNRGRYPLAMLRHAKPPRLAPLETLEERLLLAGDFWASISGTVFQDRTANGRTPDDLLLSGVVIDLYRDGGNGQIDVSGDDQFVDSATTDAAGQ